MSKKQRHIKEQELVAERQREEQLNNALKFSKRRFKKFNEVILLLYGGADLSAFFADRRIWKVHECLSRFSVQRNEQTRTRFKEMLVHLSTCSLLISREESIQAAFNMFMFNKSWQNDVLSWMPDSNRRHEQVKELASYLFCKYDVPDFMYKAFYENTNMLGIKWFIHLGSGKKPRGLVDMPIPFTQRMAHYFLQAPGEFNIQEALRWAQVRGMMGDDELAISIVYSWLGTKPYQDEEFWESFIRLLVNGGIFNYARLTELIDYVRFIRARNTAYCLKGRTIQSLFRQSEKWHNNEIEDMDAKVWRQSGIKEYRRTRDQEVIAMEEITGSKLLAHEGKVMRHCVASYAQRCISERTAIFSMRKYTSELLLETMATVEVDLHLRRIVQAKAKLNRNISDEARSCLERWADINDLTISPCL